MVAGWVLSNNHISGDWKALRKILIRGCDPSLSAYGVPNPLANPKLTVFDKDGNVVANVAGFVAGKIDGTIRGNTSVLIRASGPALQLAPFAFAMRVKWCG